MTALPPDQAVLRRASTPAGSNQARPLGCFITAECRGYPISFQSPLGNRQAFRTHVRFDPAL